MQILSRWLAAINAHDVTALAELMAPNFLFMDTLGKQKKGPKSMESGWRSYFNMCPDYWIRVDHAMAERDTTPASGEAGGGGVVEWQVFADNKPVYEILNRRKSALP